MSRTSVMLATHPLCVVSTAEVRSLTVRSRGTSDASRIALARRIAAGLRVFALLGTTRFPAAHLPALTRLRVARLSGCAGWLFSSSICVRSGNQARESRAGGVPSGVHKATIAMLAMVALVAMQRNSGRFQLTPGTAQRNSSSSSSGMPAQSAQASAGQCRMPRASELAWCRVAYLAPGAPRAKKCAISLRKTIVASL